GKAKAIIEKPFRDKVFVWALWGYGLYNIVNYYTPSKKDITTTIEKPTFKQKLQDYYTYRVVYRKALKKIKLCVFLLEHDFQLLTKAMSHTAIWMTACYQTEENLFGKMGQFEVEGNDILVGNSSTPSNRHQLIFDSLSDCKLGSSKLVIPLGYGDQEYKKTVVKRGETSFRESFTPILDFMPLDEYVKMLSSCGHVIMAHERQQAFGTLLMMLLAGAKLYLSEKSPFYDWFNDMDVKIYSVESDLAEEITTPLSPEHRASNKVIISDYLSISKRLDALQQVLERAQGFQLSQAK
ncbi:MAG: TDP-N-acetylfucosamine:lipid II N-acetylfucosaminyltransferase, partial [Crocinitomicaceae bacterium]|nr:TDP-N-acetylfucosamine:lipid II N-acetylfucosaminyltransferase [Crocinitomicaceae bacterium]